MQLIIGKKTAFVLTLLCVVLLLGTVLFLFGHDTGEDIGSIGHSGDADMQEVRQIQRVPTARKGLAKIELRHEKSPQAFTSTISEKVDHTQTKNGFGVLVVKVKYFDLRPATGQSVVLIRNNSSASTLHPFASKVTSEQGEVQFEDVLLGSYQVLCPPFTSKTIQIEAQKTTNITLTIKEGFGLTGKVVNDLEIPIRDAEIWLSTDAGGIVLAHSGVGGEFRVDGLNHLLHLIGARKEGHSPSALHQVRGFRVGTSKSIKLVLGSQGGNIAGTINDPQGRPIKRAVVEVQMPFAMVHDGHHFMETRTWRENAIEDGSFVFHGLPFGKAEVFAASAGSSAQKQKVNISGSHRLNFVLEKECSISGTVKDDKGNLVSGAYIMRRRAKGGMFIENLVWSEKDGSFMLVGLSPGELTIIVGKDGAGRTTRKFELSSEENLRWDPILDSGATIRGALTDNEGVPLVGWYLKAKLSLDGGCQRQCLTDANGLFGFDNCEEGEFTIDLFDQDRRLMDKIEHVGVGPKNLLIRFDVRKLCAIRGKLDTGSLNWKNVQVTLRGECYGNCLPNLRTGEFEFSEIPPGKYRVSLRNGKSRSTEIKNVEVIAGEKIDIGMLTFQ